MKALICKNIKKDEKFLIVSVIKKLHEFGIEADFSESVHEDCDVIITIGGDGTILHHGKNAARLNKPLLGINTGKLGFMTSLEVSELELLMLLPEKITQISKRVMLDVTIGGHVYLALNDAVFHKEIKSKLPEFKVSIGENIITEIRADGLIISTPTGSTAYALSAGGPIMEPALNCIEIVPLCAHSLFGRAMLLPTDKAIDVEFTGPPERVFVCVDGEEEIELKRNRKVVINKSMFTLNLIDLKGGSFYSAVNNKLIKPIK